MVKTEKRDDVVEVGSNLMELMEFSILKLDQNGERGSAFFGINVFKVREIVLMPEVYPYPEAPPNILGVINLRNETIPLLNLIARLGGIEDVPLEDQLVIVSEFSGKSIGFVVHEARQIHRLSWDSVLPSPDAIQPDGASLVVGVVTLKEDHTILILDFEKIADEVAESEDEDFKVTEDLKLDTDEKEFRIVVADDSGMMRRLIKKVLTEMGATVETVGDGGEAFRIMERYRQEADSKGCAVKDLVQLVLTDIEMPQMDGYTLTKNIKTNSAFSGIPVVMHTSLSGQNVQDRGREVGVDDYVTKFHPELLVVAVKKAIG